MKATKRRPAGTRWGRQPAYEAIRRYVLADEFDHNITDAEIFAKAAKGLSQDVGFEVNPRTLANTWCSGINLPPAEIKLGLAEMLFCDLEDLWTPEVLAGVWGGVRGNFGR